MVLQYCNTWRISIRIVKPLELLPNERGLNFLLETVPSLVFFVIMTSPDLANQSYENYLTDRKV